MQILVVIWITYILKLATWDTLQAHYFAGVVLIKEVSTSTAESEIKAVNHTLKCEVIANRGMLTMMGWKQAPTIIEEGKAHVLQPLQHYKLLVVFAIYLLQRIGF